MKWTSESLLELIDLERRPSAARRVLSVAGLVLGGGLLGAAIVMVTKMVLDEGPSEKLSDAAQPAHAMPPSYDGARVGFGEGDSHA
ncbi:MAG: hypothetical protein Q8L14_22640 [Myxococcales bacterium]|nr:hypothetical protein [Myxococcales bacterium]